MSLYAPSQTVGLVPTEDCSCPSSTPWIVGLVILFLIALGLGIWLLVLYLGGHVGGGSDRLITVTSPSITANANDVTASWGTLSNETDKVTLYVSEKPLIINNNGTVINTADIIKQDNKTGSNGSLDITVPSNASYNAMMVVTNTDTVNFLVYGPRKVFTQTNPMLVSNPTNAEPGTLFNIRDLDSCNGAVTSNGGYTTVSSLAGIFRFGSPTEPGNTFASSFLVSHGSDPSVPDPTDNVLCRLRETTTEVGMGVWIGTTNGVPVVCTRAPANNSTTTCDAGTSIPNANCQWSYNENPTAMRGQNKWCLTSPQSATANSSVNVPLCLVHNNSGSLAVAQGSTSTDTWYNSPATSNIVL